MSTIIARLERADVRMTPARRIVADVLSKSDDHPDAEELYNRVKKIDSTISLATVYRTLKVFDEVGAVDRHEFGDGRARYEDAAAEHHDHLIDVRSGDIIEFTSPEIEALQIEIANKLGYELVDHRLELYGVPKSKKTKRKKR